MLNGVGYISLNAAVAVRFIWICPCDVRWWPTRARCCCPSSASSGTSVAGCLCTLVSRRCTRRLKNVCADGGWWCQPGSTMRPHPRLFYDVLPRPLCTDWNSKRNDYKHKTNPSNSDCKGTIKYILKKNTNTFLTCLEILNSYMAI